MVTRMNSKKTRRKYDRYREDREFWWNKKEMENLYVERMEQFFSANNID